jgi:hypothetical protein
VSPYTKGYEDALRDIIGIAFACWGFYLIQKGKLFKGWKPSLALAGLCVLVMAFGAFLSFVIFPIIHLLNGLFSGGG